MQEIVKQNIRKFILAGKAFFTVRNKETGNRYSFRVYRATDYTTNGEFPWFVWIRSGKKYVYLGSIFPTRGFRATTRSRISENDIRFKAFKWLYENAKNLPAKVEVFHEGRCCVCGRALTTPESIERGMGPVCWENQWQRDYTMDYL